MVYRPESVTKRVEKLKEYGADLRALGTVTLERYLAEKPLRYQVERILYLISETTLDVVDHVLTTRHDVLSETYEDLLVSAASHGIISGELSGELRGLGGFRNVLAHDYIGLSNEEVYRHLVKMTGLLDRLIEELAGLA
jgi:uncharacterized protein YutE (UPF0331/DUF86 family)